jgi:hypothetical protein
MVPLTDKGKKIMSSMVKKHGKKKGEQVFYASKNKGTIKNVDVVKAAMGRSAFSTTTSTPGVKTVLEAYTGSFIKSNLAGKYVSNKSYEKYYGDLLKGFKK